MNGWKRLNLRRHDCASLLMFYYPLYFLWMNAMLTTISFRIIKIIYILSEVCSLWLTDWLTDWQSSSLMFENFLITFIINLSFHLSLIYYLVYFVLHGNAKLSSGKLFLLALIFSFGCTNYNGLYLKKYYNTIIKKRNNYLTCHISWLIPWISAVAWSNSLTLWFWRVLILLWKLWQSRQRLSQPFKQINIAGCPQPSRWHAMSREDFVISSSSFFITTVSCMISTPPSGIVVFFLHKGQTKIFPLLSVLDTWWPIQGKQNEWPHIRVFGSLITSIHIEHSRIEIIWCRGITAAILWT